MESSTFRPTSSNRHDRHDISNNGAPQVIINGPYQEACSRAPSLASFEFIPGQHNWGYRNVPPKLLKVDWPVIKVHEAKTMGDGGVAEGGWMKNAFCMCYEKAEEKEISVFKQLLDSLRHIILSILQIIITAIFCKSKK